MTFTATPSHICAAKLIWTSAMTTDFVDCKYDGRGLLAALARATLRLGMLRWIVIALGLQLSSCKNDKWPLRTPVVVAKDGQAALFSYCVFADGVPLSPNLAIWHDGRVLYRRPNIKLEDTSLSRRDGSTRGKLYWVRVSPLVAHQWIAAFHDAIAQVQAEGDIAIQYDTMSYRMNATVNGHTRWMGFTSAYIYDTRALEQSQANSIRANGVLVLAEGLRHVLSQELREGMECADGEFSIERRLQ